MHILTWYQQIHADTVTIPTDTCRYMHIPTQSRLPRPAVCQCGPGMTRNSVASLRLLEHWRPWLTRISYRDYCQFCCWHTCGRGWRTCTCGPELGSSLCQSPWRSPRRGHPMMGPGVGLQKPAMLHLMNQSWPVSQYCPLAAAVGPDRTANKDQPYQYSKSSLDDSAG